MKLWAKMSSIFYKNSTLKIDNCCRSPLGHTNSECYTLKGHVRVLVYETKTEIPLFVVSVLLDLTVI